MKKLTSIQKAWLVYVSFVLLTLTIPALSYVANSQPDLWPTWLPEWLFAFMTDDLRLIKIALACAFALATSLVFILTLAGSLTGSFPMSLTLALAAIYTIHLVFISLHQLSSM